MGLFSFLGKIGKVVGGVAGGLAKTAIGVAGGPLGNAGLALFKAIKQTGQAKKAAKLEAMTMQNQAMVAKVRAPAKKTAPEVALKLRGSDTLRELSFLKQKGRMLAETRELAPVRARREAFELVEQGEQAAAKKKKGLSPGMLDFAAMSRHWQAAGKPGTWKAWTSNPQHQVRKGA